MKKVVSILCILSVLLLYSKALQAESSPGQTIISFDSHSLFKSDGSYWVWGHPYSVPTQIHGLEDIQTPLSHHFVVRSDSSVWHWKNKPNSPDIEWSLIEGIADVIEVQSSSSEFVMRDVGAIYTGCQRKTL